MSHFILLVVVCRKDANSSIFVYNLAGEIIRKYWIFIKFYQGLPIIIICAFLDGLQKSSSCCQKDLKLVFVTMS